MVLLLACGVVAGWARAQRLPGRNAVNLGGLGAEMDSVAAAGSNQAQIGEGGTLNLRGEMETVTGNAVGILASDGCVYEALLPGAGPLRARALVNTYHVGDEVDFEAVVVEPQYVATDNRFYQLQLRQLKFRQHSSGGTLRKALASPAWRSAAPPNG